MSKTKIDWGIITSFGFTVLLGFLCFRILGAIHTPSAPEAISLPLGQQNRTETLHMQGTRYGISSDAYIIRYDVTLQNLPRGAWCGQSRNNDKTLFLDCTWATPGQPVAFASAEIDVPVPAAEGLARWEFNRESLQAVPVMQGWFWFNFEKFMLFVIFCVFCIVSGLSFINACLNVRDRARKNKRPAQA